MSLTILDAVARRHADPLSGNWFAGRILPASAFIRSLGTCLDDPACAERYGVSNDAWLAGMKAAEHVLAYTDEAMKITKGDAKEPTTGSIFDFECVITSTRKDRDGDVLHSDGADPDPQMPLLYQHLPMMPIGKLNEILSQNAKRVTGSFSVAPTALGYDAALLAEFGALRISHGFKPIKYAELRPERGETGPAGWDITKFQIMETSLVSIPSNTDAQITAFSRGKLHHPLVKAWAKDLWNKRSTSVVGGWDPENGPAPAISVAAPVGKSMVKAKWKKRSQNRLSPKGTMGLGDCIKLRKACDHMKDCRSHAETTAACKTLVGKARKLVKAVMTRHWGDANQGSDGTPNPDADGSGKAYARKKDLVKLGSAMDHLDAAYKSDGMAPKAKTMCKAAQALVREVHAKHSCKRFNAGKLATKLVAALYLGKCKRIDAATLELLKEAALGRLDTLGGVALSDAGL